MEERESNERKNLFIRTIIVIILLLLAFLSTVLYVFLYPKTRVYLYDTDYTPIRSFEVKRYSNLSSLPDVEKSGYTFKYWTYDDFEINGGTILNKEAELTEETISLYANYQANSYRITYHIQYYNEKLGQYMYDTYKQPEICEFGKEITLPDGRDSFGNLLTEFSNKQGYHFVGWTTKVVSEDDPNVQDYLKYAGQKYVVDIPSDIDFYAYFEKNQYDINLHTGIQYELDGNTPKKDANGEYIIKNITNDPNNDKESILTNKVRYMDSLTGFTSDYSDISLSETNGGMAYAEYEFCGWYLDADYTYPIENQELPLMIDSKGRPYYEYLLSQGDSKIIYASDTGNKDSDGNSIYVFDIYSKWQRKKYEVSFNKNSNSSNGKIEPIYLYKVFLDDQGLIIDEYGKYYNDGDFTYEGYKNGGHYSRVDLTTLDVVSEKFRDSNKGYRLIGWADNSNLNDENTIKYAWWQQEPSTDQAVKDRITGLISYKEPSKYVHTLSSSAVLYAQWSKIYTIKFAYAQGTGQKYFEYSGIEGEWFVLPNMADIIRITGSEWTKKYNYFAGWTTGTSSLATKYLEKTNDGDPSPDFKYEIGRTSATLIVYWLKTPYTVKFYLNDNDDSTGGSVFETYSPVYGGTYKYFPKNPTREGYIFDGWSKTDYKTNEYSTKKRQVKDGNNVGAFDSVYTSSSNFLIDGDGSYYASWTTNFEIEYDANGGTFVGNATTKYTYAQSGSGNLKINLYVGSGLKGITYENFIFKGWKVKISDGVVGDNLIKTSDVQKTTFDFYSVDGKYYYYNYKADGITVSDSEKTEMFLQDGKKVVLVAQWEPKKYNVTIKDTLANGDKTATQITLSVAFNEEFKFPKENALGELLDSKIGYKLLGFSTTDGGEIVYAIDGDTYPTIEPYVITRNCTFYTVYERKTITVEFKAKLLDHTEENPSIMDFDDLTQNNVNYGAILTLPVRAEITDPSTGKKLKFKYWYYEKDGKEIKIVTGDKASYHNADNKLIIYGHFEVESYEVSIGITNPYVDSSFIVSTIALDPQEKNSQISKELYDSIMAQVYEKLETLLSDYLIYDGDNNIVKGVYKGFKLLGLYTTTFDDKFEAGKSYNSDNFRTLGFNTTGMTVITKWSPNDVQIVYNATEDGSGDKKTQTVKFNVESITLENANAITTTGGKIIRSWYIFDGTNKLFFDCSSILVGYGSKYGYGNLNAIQKYITWDENGKGTLNIYANTEQQCEIKYYTFNGKNIQELTSQQFIFGEEQNLSDGSSAIVGDFIDKDMKFNGWYLNGYNGIKFNGGASVSALRNYLNEGNEYTIELYADLTFEKSIYYTQIDGNIKREILRSNEIINILKYNDTENKYYYINSITLKTCPELTADEIPSGYDYYGLKHGDNVYKKEDIEGTGVSIDITGENIRLVTFYTQDYVITYRVLDGAEFEDKTTEDKTEPTYKIGIDGTVIGGDIIIKYGAQKSGYVFSGWKISSDTVYDTNVYKVGDIFSPTTNTTIFVPYFEVPEAGKINAKLTFIKENDSTDILEYEYLTSDGKLSLSQTDKHITNGYSYTFTGTVSADVKENGVSDMWTGVSRDLYKWVDGDGNEYFIGDTFTIPRAIVSGQEFTFTGVWIDKYSVEFNQPVEYSQASGYTPKISLHKGVEYKLQETPVMIINGAQVEGVEFKYWIYNDNGTSRIIKVNDIIVLNKDGITNYKSFENLNEGNTTHYLPALKEGVASYEFLGEWNFKTYNVTLIVKEPKTSNTYTLTLHNVPFGTIISSRDMLNSDYLYLKDESGNITSNNSTNLTTILGLENDSRGIVGWSQTDGGSIDLDALNGVTEDMTLYACWQQKYTLTFASANDDTSFNYTDYKTISGIKYLPYDEIDVNNVIKSIYAKGYTTVYLENGKWILTNASNNDYYSFLSGFTSNVVITNTGDGKTLAIDDDGTFSSFTMPASNVILTPVLEKIHKVNFYDNTDENGGNLVENTEGVEKYIQFVRTGRTISLDASTYNASRKTFEFMGWNIDKDSDNIINSVTANESDGNINLYAIWVSNRKAKFQISTTSASGVTNRTMLEMPLTKDNKINKTILEEYLDGKEVGSGDKIVAYDKLYKMTELVKLNHQAYVYNDKNYLFEGFIVSKNGISTVLTLEEIIAEDFGSNNYSQNEDVVITFNFIDIFSIVYKTTYTDIEGTINSPDYFIASGSKIGKLVEKTEGTLGIEDSITLPEPSVTRKHFQATMWATKEVVSDSVVKYTLNSEECIFNASKLNSIASSLKNSYSQKYELYVIWEFEQINIHVYAIADVINAELPENEGKDETVLTNPYNAYVNANETGSNISFANIPNIINKDGSRIIVVGNFAYSDDEIAIAQVRYNDVITLERDDLSFVVGGFELVGFSTTLFKLGYTPKENEYFKLGDDITIDESVISTDGINLYPVYKYVEKDVTIESISGGATIESTFEPLGKDGKILSETNCGYVSVDGVGENQTYTLTDEENSKDLKVKIFTKLVITANSPKEGYSFEHFDASIDDEGFITAGDESYIGVVDFTKLYNDTNKSISSCTISVHYEASSVNISVTLNYGTYTLKDGYLDNGSISFIGIDDNNGYFEKTLDRNNQSATIKSRSINSIYYSLSQSDYYDFIIYNGSDLVTLKNGSIIEIKTLNLSNDKTDGYYTTALEIVAVPKTYNVSFIMSRGVFKTDAKINATSSIYNNVTSFDIVDNQAKVFANSTITLPDGSSMIYSKGLFVKFYLNGDSNKTQVTEHTVDKDVVFVEVYDDNAYTIQYIYEGLIEYVSGIAPNSQITIGTENARMVAGRELKYWSFTQNGEKAFVDNQLFTVDKSYVLYGVYEGSQVTFKYEYLGYDSDNNTTTCTKIEYGKNGEDFTLLDPSTLDNVAVDGYIYGWKYGDKEFQASQTIAFTQLGYEYVVGGENVITFEAIVYDTYNFEVSYDTSDLSNGENFQTFTHKVRKTGVDTYILSDLKVTVSSVVPVKKDDENSWYFVGYILKYQINGGEWNTITTEDKDKIVSGGNFNISTEWVTESNVKFLLVPTFSSTNTIIKVNYNLTNPNSSEIDNDTFASVVAENESKITNLEFNSGLSFSDDYLLAMSCTEGSNSATFTINAKNISFTLQIENVDWFEYKLLGYHVKFLDNNDTVLTERDFYFGKEGEENRSLAGTISISLTPIWEDKYVIKYYNQENNLVKKDYIDYSSDISDITLLNKEDFDNLDSFGMSGYSFVGWTKISENNHIISTSDDYVAFGKSLSVESTNRKISLYPAQSKIYTLRFNTYGIDDSDRNNFLFKNFTAPNIYLGINESNTLDMTNYNLGGSYFDYSDLKNIYSLYDDSKYTFTGFASTMGGDTSTSYTFSSSSIDGDYIDIYVVFTKNGYSIKFTFEGYANDTDAKNLLSGYTYEIYKYYGDKLDFSWNYDISENYFDLNEATKDDDSWISNIKNASGVTLEEQINAIIKEVGIDFLREMVFSHNLGAINYIIDTNEEYTVVGVDTINILFTTPIIRLQYQVLYGSEVDGKEVDNMNIYSEVIKLDDVVTEYISVDKIKSEGYNLRFWSVDNSSNFFADGSHTIIASDIETSKLTETYRLTITTAYSTEYTLNFYYFESLENLRAYDKDVEENTVNDLNKYYTQLTTLSVSLGDTIGKYERDANGNYKYDNDYNLIPIYSDAENKVQATIFDAYLNENTVTISLGNGNTVQINKFQDFFTVFNDYQYSSDGKVKVNDDQYGYRSLNNTENYYYSIYMVQSYGTTEPLVNNVYIQYERIEHDVYFTSAVVVKNDDGTFTYNKDVAGRYNVFGEYATTEEQIKDDGSDSIAYENTRRIANTVNSDYMNNDEFTYMDTIYLIITPFVRLGTYVSDSFKFEGWGVLVDDGNGSYTYKTLSESGLTVTETSIEYEGTTIEYWEVTNVTEEIILVAIYSEVYVDVEINLTSEDNNGDNLRLYVYSLWDNLLSDYSDVEIEKDKTNHIAKYSIQVLYSSYLSIDVYKGELDGVKISENYIIGEIRIGTYINKGSINITVGEGNITDGKIVIYAKYKQIPYELLLKIDETVDNTRYVGDLSEVNYTLGNQNASSSLTYEGNEYNYSTEVPAGAVISGTTFGTPSLNNFTFVKWQYLNNTTNTWQDLDSIIVKNIANADKKIYIKAIFTPNTINVKYVVERVVEGTTYQKEIEGLTSTATYGSSVTLPYAIVETDEYIIVGWNYGDFGSKAQVLSAGNFAMTEFVIKAKTQEIAYVQFSKGDTKFVIPNDYPNAKNNSNKITEKNVEISSGTKYYYNIVEGNNSLSVGDIKTADKNIILRSNTYTIPSADITSEDENVFDKWASRTGTFYKNGEVYNYNYSDVVDGVITLTSVADNYIRVSFYISNPVNVSENLKLTTNKDIKADIECITLLIDKSTNNNYVDVDYTNSTEQLLNVNAMNSTSVDVQYFIPANLRDNYKFYGWSTEKGEVFTNITSLLTSTDNFDNGGNKYFSYYTATSSDGYITAVNKKGSANIGSYLKEFIDYTGARTLYAIWEQKYEVKFLKNNGNVNNANDIISSGKYAYYDLVSFPNPDDYTKEAVGIEDEGQKWIGWQLQGATYTQEFVNNSASMYFTSQANQVWIPLTQAGYTITFDTNFPRNTFADIMSSYGVSTSDVLAKTRYPYINLGNNNMTPTGSSVTIGDKTYYSSYKYGDLWTSDQWMKTEEKDGETIYSGIYSIINNVHLTDEGIYPTDESLPLSNATWLTSYYSFSGWSLSSTGDTGILTADDLKNYKLEKNTTFYAIWTPITLNINFCVDETNAKAESVLKTETITFGSKFNISDYMGEEFIKSMPELNNQDHKKFKNWNVTSPLNSTILNQANLHLINDQYLYAEYQDCYTVVFKTQEGVDISEQGDGANNRQKVVNGDNVYIKNYITNTLGQNLNEVSEIFYTNNSGNKEIINKETLSLVFNSDGISSNDKQNFTFTIYLNISYNVNLYARNSASDSTVTEVHTLEGVSPEHYYYINSGDDFKLDMSRYDNIPTFAGWFYYETYTSDAIYTVNDLDNAISKFIITKEDGKTKLIITTIKNKEIVYELSSMEINFYAKLLATQTISLGDENNRIIQKYAQLSLIESDYVLLENTETIITTVNGVPSEDVKSLKVTTAFGSPKNIQFTIATEGYILNSISSSDGALNGYIPQNDALANSQDFTGNYTAKIEKKTDTSKEVNSETKSGMFITYTFSLSNILQNNYSFAMDITPYVFNVSYVVNSQDGYIRGSKGEDLSTSTSLNVVTATLIYQPGISQGIGASESNSIYIAYTYVVDSKTTSVNFTNVPYGAKISLTYTPTQIMHKHFDNVGISYKNANDKYESVGISTSDAGVATLIGIGVNVDTQDLGRTITYAPIQKVGEKSAESFAKDYQVDVNFVANTISSFELYLDYSYEDNNKDSLAPWINILGKTINNTNKYEHTKSDIKFTTDGNAFTRYVIRWKTDTSNVSAGTEISSLLNDWKVSFHDQFEKDISGDSANLSQGSITLAQLMNYFWLNNSATFVTDVKDITGANTSDNLVEYENGCLKDNIIYSLDGKTVQLHISLDRAMIANVDTEIIDYADEAKTVNAKKDGKLIERAKVSLNQNSSDIYTADEDIIIYNSNNIRMTYTAGTQVSSILAKMPMDENVIFEFTTTPDSASENHVAYIFSSWKSGGSIDENVKNSDVLKLDTSNANDTISSIFSTFGTIAGEEVYPDANILGQVKAETYNVKFYNAKDKKEINNKISEINIAYDKEISEYYDSNEKKYSYEYYAYTLEKLYSEAYPHTLPKFAGVKTGGFVHPVDEEENNSQYGEFKYLFKHWSLTDGGDKYAKDSIVKSTTGTTYNDMTFYACYDKTVKIIFTSFVNSGENADTFDLYLAEINFKDQFENEYDKLITSSYSGLETWQANNPNTVTDTNGKYIYYVKGSDNSEHIQVKSLEEIEDFYKANPADGGYIVYPCIEVKTTVTFNPDNYTNKNNEYKFKTLGGKIEYLAYYDDSTLYLYNIITTDTTGLENEDEYSKVDTLTPNSYTTYSFAVWQVNANYVTPDKSKTVETKDGEQIVTSESTNVFIYGRYNVLVTIKSSNYGNSKINDEKYNTEEWIQLLESPSYKVITASDHELRKHLVIKFVNKDTNNYGYMYGVLQIIDETDENKKTTLINIQYVAKEKYFDNIVFQISTINGKSKTLSEVDETWSMEDSYGAYTITPIAVPKEVTLTLDSFTITNIDDTLLFQNAFDYQARVYNETTGEYTETYTSVEAGVKLTIKGGATFNPLATINIDDKSANASISLELIGGSTIDDLLKANSNSVFSANGLYEHLTNFKWEYKNSNGTWSTMEVGDMASSDMTIRLSAEWKYNTYTFKNINDVEKPENEDYLTVNINGTDWKVKDQTYEKATFNGSSSLEFKLYSGETLKLKSETTFEITDSPIKGRVGQCVELDEDSGYFQGWCIVDNSSLKGLTEKVITFGYADNSDQTIVSWVENQDYSFLLVYTEDSWSGAEGENFVAGYGNVTYSITTPFGKDNYNYTKTPLDDTNTNNAKNYGSVMSGRSSEVKITLAENDKAQHEVRGITGIKDPDTGKYDGKRNVSEITTTISELDMFVYIAFDASPTESQYGFAYGTPSVGNILDNSLQYTIYGGYNIYYEKGTSDDIVVVKINNYWNELEKTFEICTVDSETHDNGKIYPNNSNLGMYSIDLYTKIGDWDATESGIINEELSKPSNIWEYSNKLNENVKGTAYSGDKTRYILLLNEYVNKLTLNYVLKCGESDTKYSLNSEIAYIKDNEDNIITSSSSSIAGIIPNDLKSSYIQYNTGSQSIELSVANKFFGNIVASSGTYQYTLNSVSISTDKDGNNSVASCTYPSNYNATATGNTKSWDINSTYYYVIIYLNQKTTVDVAFKLTLPNDNDLINLEMYNYGGNALNINNANGDGVLVTTSIPVGSEYTLNGYNLTIYGNNNGKLYEITIGNTSIYNLSGWCMDDSFKHLLLQEDSTNANKKDYTLYSYSGDPMGANGTISRDCTITLVADRKPLSIYLDTGAIWSKMGKTDITSSDDEEQKLVNYVCNNSSAVSGYYTYSSFSGLVSLTPVVDAGTTHSTGDPRTGRVYNGKYIAPINIDYTRKADSDGNVFTLNLNTEKNNNTKILKYFGVFENAYFVLGKSGNNFATGMYDVELTQSDTWLLLSNGNANTNSDGTAQQGSKPQSAKDVSLLLTLHSRGYYVDYENYNSTLIQDTGVDTKVEYNFRKDINHTFSLGKVENNTFTVYSSKFETYRSYEDLLSYKPYYGYATMNFTFEVPSVYESRYINAKDQIYLCGYKIVRSDGITSTEYRLNEDDVDIYTGIQVNLSSFTGTVDVYPIFTKVPVVTVTLDYELDLDRYTYDVIYGKDYTLELPLETMTLSSDGYGNQKTYQTTYAKNSTTRILYALSYPNTVNGVKVLSFCNIFEIENNVLNQTGSNFLKRNAGDGKYYFVLKIDSVTQDINIWAEFADLQTDKVDYNLTNSDEISYYVNVPKTYTVTLSNMVKNMSMSGGSINPLPKVSVITNLLGEHKNYYKVVDSDNLKAVKTSDRWTVEYKLSHNNHRSVSSTYYKGCSCYTTVSYYCYYCNAGLGTSSSENHAYDRNNSEYWVYDHRKKEETAPNYRVQHDLYKILYCTCSYCNENGYGISKEFFTNWNHSFKTEYININSTTHTIKRTCRWCGYWEKESPENHTWTYQGVHSGTEIESVGKGKHSYESRTCSVCGKVDNNNGNGFVDDCDPSETYLEAQYCVDPTGNLWYDQYYYYCETCKGGWYVDTKILGKHDGTRYLQSKDKDYHYVICGDCEKTIKTIKHSFTITQEATCQNQGKKECACKYTKYIDKVDHSYEVRSKYVGGGPCTSKYSGKNGYQYWMECKWCKKSAPSNKNILKGEVYTITVSVCLIRAAEDANYYSKHIGNTGIESLDYVYYADKYEVVTITETGLGGTLDLSYGGHFKDGRYTSVSVVQTVGRNYYHTYSKCLYCGTSLHYVT